MISDSRSIALYHASYTIIETVNLSYCKKRNDFGRGFYLTTSCEQAKQFVKTSVLKSGRIQNSGFVNMYCLRDFEGLACHEFVTADKEWLHCVSAFRRSELFPDKVAKWESYDVIIGKIANDNTMATLTIYLQNGYGEIGSVGAIETAIRTLKPERLQDQVCLKTESALAKLGFVEAFEVDAK